MRNWRCPLRSTASLLTLGFDLLAPGGGLKPGRGRPVAMFEPNPPMAGSEGPLADILFGD